MDNFDVHGQKKDIDYEIDNEDGKQASLGKDKTDMYATDVVTMYDDVLVLDYTFNIETGSNVPDENGLNNIYKDAVVYHTTIYSNGIEKTEKIKAENSGTDVSENLDIAVETKKSTNLRKVNQKTTKIQVELMHEA